MERGWHQGHQLGTEGAAPSWPTPWSDEIIGQFRLKISSDQGVGWAGGAVSPPTRSFKYKLRTER